MNTLVLQPVPARQSAVTAPVRRATVPDAAPREAQAMAARPGAVARLRAAAGQWRQRRHQARRLREEGALLMALGQHQLNDLGVGWCELGGHLRGGTRD